MYASAIAEQLRARGRDVVCVHDAEYRRFEGARDEELFAVALAEGRALVTESRLTSVGRSDALAADPRATLVFTSNRRFPRGEPGTIGRRCTSEKPPCAMCAGFTKSG